MRTSVLVILLCATLATSAGCQTATRPTASTPSSSQPAATQPATPAATPSDWAKDLPLWMGAKYSEVQKGDYSPPQPGSGWTKTEWKYYQFPAAIPELRNFYRSEMPKAGWTQLSWTDPDVNTHVSYWTKNGGTDGAMLWVVSLGRGVFVATARSAK